MVTEIILNKIIMEKYVVPSISEEFSQFVDEPFLVPFFDAWVVLYPCDINEYISEYFLHFRFFAILIQMPDNQIVLQFCHKLGEQE